MNKLYQEFLNDLKLQNKSDMTIDTYSRQFTGFVEFMQEFKGVDIESYTAEDFESIDWIAAREWMTYSKKDGGVVSPNTFNIRHNTLKSFYNYLFEYEYISRNIINKIKKQKTGKRIPIYLTKAEIHQVFEFLNSSNSFTFLRNRAVIYTFLTTGIRESEMMALKKEDLEGNALSVRSGKGNKDRVLYLPDETVRHINKYLSKRDDNRQELFLNIHGEPINHYSLNMVIKSIMTRAGIDKQISAHKLRHSYATLLLGETNDLALTQDVLGHASPATTRIYAQVTNEHKKNSMKNVLSALED